MQTKDWCLIEIEKEETWRDLRRETRVILALKGHESVSGFRLHYAWFETWALIGGVRAEDLSADETYAVPVRIGTLSEARARRLAFGIFWRKTKRHPRRILAHGAGLIRFLRAKNPVAWLAGDCQVCADPYQAWIATHERGGAAVDSEGGKHRLSIVLEPGSAEPGILEAGVESVAGQTVKAFEVCLTDGDPAVAHFQKGLRESGPRVSTGAAEGDYVVFLKAGDCLAKEAIAEYGRAIDANPDAVLIYADDDRLDALGVRHSPRFKPAWSPDLLRSGDYIGRAFCVKRSAWPEGTDGFGLLLRIGENAGRDGIVRIPKVLYHARSGGENAGGDGKALEALEAHVKRIGRRARVTAGEHGFRVQWELPDEPRCSVIILTRDRPELLSVCVRSVLEKTTYGNYEIVIVDNGSVEAATTALFRELEGNDRVSVLRNDCEFNFARLNNFAVEHASGEYYCFLNNDMEVISPGWLTEMVSHAARVETGCVGVKLFYPDGRIQHAGVVTGLGGTAGHAHRFFSGQAAGYLGRLQQVQNVSVVTAACLVMRAEIFREAGGFCEELAVNYNDVDFCLKVREAGYFNVWSPYAELFHHESVSRGVENTREKRKRADREERLMAERWGKTLGDDPYYSPNLTREREDYSIGE